MRIVDTAQLEYTSDLTSNEREWIYNGFDAAVTYEIRDKLLSYLDETTRKTYDFSLALQAPIMEMSMRGLLVDPDTRMSMLIQVKDDIEFLEARLTELLRDGVGYPAPSPRIWASSHQLKSLFYDVMGIKPITKRGAKGERVPTVDRGALEKLSINFLAEPICKHILVLRDLDKKRQFLETGIDPDGRFRFGFNIAGTNSGRLSSFESELGSGSNSQNVGRSLRKIFVADPGMKFANLDLEQADSRNVGAICWNIFHDLLGDRAGAYLDACESGDLHTTVCRMANPQLEWGVDPTGWRAVADQIAYRADSYRDLAKKLGHGTNYYGQPFTMAQHSKVPVKQVEAFQRSYFSGFPEIVHYHTYVKNELIENSAITTLFGRRRFFFGRPRDDATIREAIAYSPQSMTAEEINRGMMELWRGSNRIQLLTQVHDSILFQFPEEEEDEIIPWALAKLKVVLELAHGRTFHVPVEAKTGWNWGDWEKTGGNPDGLIKWKGHDPRKRLRLPRKSFRLF